MDGKNAKQLRGLMLNEEQLKFEYSLAKYRNECARNELWKQRNLLKRLRQQRDGVPSDHNNNNHILHHQVAVTDHIDYLDPNHHDSSKTRRLRQQQTSKRLSTERLVKSTSNPPVSSKHCDIPKQTIVNNFISGNKGIQLSVEDSDPLRVPPSSIRKDRHTTTTKDSLMERIKMHELRSEMESLQRTLKNMMSEHNALKKQHVSIQDIVFDLESKIEIQRAHFITMKRARSLPDVSLFNSKSPTSSAGCSGTTIGSNRVSSARPKRRLPSIATSLRVKMSLIALKKRAQQRIEQRKREEHVPFPELSRRSAAKLK